MSDLPVDMDAQRTDENRVAPAGGWLCLVAAGFIVWQDWGRHVSRWSLIGIVLLSFCAGTAGRITSRLARR